MTPLVAADNRPPPTPLPPPCFDRGLGAQEEQVFGLCPGGGRIRLCGRAAGWRCAPLSCQSFPSRGSVDPNHPPPCTPTPPEVHLAWSGKRRASSGSATLPRERRSAVQQRKDESKTRTLPGYRSPPLSTSGPQPPGHSVPVPLNSFSFIYCLSL